MSYVMSLKSYSTFQISLYPARIDIKWVYINMPDKPFSYVESKEIDVLNYAKRTHGMYVWPFCRIITNGLLINGKYL